MTPALYTACERAIHIITPDGQIIKAGRAAMFILTELGYPRWLIAPFMRRPLLWFVELGYHVVAENRPLFSKILFTEWQLAVTERENLAPFIYKTSLIFVGVLLGIGLIFALTKARIR